MNARQLACLQEMGFLPLWQLRMHEQTIDVDVLPAMDEPASVAMPAAPPVEPSPSSAPVLEAPPAVLIPSPRIIAGAGEGGWDGLLARIRTCQACRLHETRTQTVPGVGDRQADWMFIGEAPGAEEDRRGEPFVGAAGQLLDRMLAAIGLDRQREVYIANTLKCRPPGNRNPALDEMAACSAFLSEQIALVRPRLLIALGRPAAHALLQHEVSIRTVRGRLLDYQGIPLVVTYHPAYLLRNPHDKGKAWEDLCFARATMRGLKTASA